MFKVTRKYCYCFKYVEEIHIHLKYMRPEGSYTKAHNIFTVSLPAPFFSLKFNSQLKLKWKLLNWQIITINNNAVNMDGIFPKISLMLNNRRKMMICCCSIWSAFKLLLYRCKNIIWRDRAFKIYKYFQK